MLASHRFGPPRSPRRRSWSRRELAARTACSRCSLPLPQANTPILHQLHGSGSSAQPARGSTTPESRRSIAAGCSYQGTRGPTHACKRPRAGVAGDDNPPRRPSRVHVPRRVAAVPPPGLVPRPLPARDSDVPESASAALHDAVLHRADRDDGSTSRSHSGTGLPPIPPRPSRGSTHGSPGTSAFTNVGPRHWRAAVELGLPLAAGRKQKQK